jgi:hypothetical protein
MKVLVAFSCLYTLLTGQTLGRISGATPFAAGFQASAPGEATRGVTLPRFEEYPSTRLFTGRPAPALVDSAPYGRMYRTRLRQGSSDPVHAGDPPLDTCAACGVPAAYEWNGSRFEPVGSGPHPHPFGDRPW